ncbi:hypothetical protein HGA91_05325 [candidate division WWE3 bacterium]|nr:hypothetical protein [candidate division WWE3 bacterium]
MKIALEELSRITLAALKKYGYTDKESEIISQVLLYAQLRNSNQGIVKLIGSGIPKHADAETPIIKKETPASLLLDGNHTHAIIVMDQLTDLAIKKAKEVGIAITGNNNTTESTGALGYYVHKIADAGLIGIAFSSAPYQTTAPHGSNQGRFCTNPLAYGIPTQANPIILDMTTSSMAYYGLIEAKTAGQSVPMGTGYDANGTETTDPSEIMNGALKTFGGHKGSGLALIVQIFASALVGADYFNDESENSGNLVIAINPEIFIDSADFKHNVSDMIAKVKNARKVDGVEEIYVPGERSHIDFEQATQSGFIEIETNLLTDLKKVIGEK